MRFSDQFQRYQRDFSREPGTIECTWMKRDRGRIAKLSKVMVSPEAARHFKIEAPCLLDKERALRIIAWQKEKSGPRSFLAVD